jgi:NitT/TauT family transport system ATP-binding protein
MTTVPQPATAVGQEVILAARNVSKWYGTDQQKLLVLDRISLDIRSGEFIALLGPSGSGKSTFLRILAGLIPASDGEVLAHGVTLSGANRQVAMVFQNFALYPWLTVMDNVELGLLDMDLKQDERHERAVRAIDLIGLDGFEDAYPRELSGGMKQRVGFARALVVEPEVLFMDEPFSALDVLVAENLRHELLDLWHERKIPTRAILMVTHNIDEAVGMADRLVVFGADPGHIRVELPGLPLALRTPKTESHARLADTCYRIMTNPKADAGDLVKATPQREALPPLKPYQALPHVGIDALTGFVERLYALGGKEDVYKMARDLRMEADDILPLVEAADVLGLADTLEGDVILTETGQKFAEAGVLEEKEIFRACAERSIELIRDIQQALKESREHWISENGILEKLEAAFGEDEARRQLDTAIDWARYAELFAYDDNTGEFYLEDYGQPRQDNGASAQPPASAPS